MTPVRPSRIPSFTFAFAVAAGVAVCVLWPRTGAAVPRPRVDPAARRAELETFLRVGRYEDALRAADETARRTPDEPRWPVFAARAERALGRYAEARRRLTAAAERWPDDLPLRAVLLEVLGDLGDRAAQKPLIDRTYDDWAAHRVDRRNAADLLAVTVALRLDNNYKDANDTVRAAVAAAHDETGPELLFGDLFLEKYAAGDAEISYRRVLKLDPGNPDAHVGLARVLLEQGNDIAGARQELAAALAVNPRHAGALAVDGDIALDGEDFPRAAELAAKLRHTNPHDPLAASLAGARALLLDDRPGWQRERSARLAVHPADGAFFARVAEAMVHQRRYAEAREVAEDGIAIAPDDAACLASLGKLLLSMGEETAGVDLLRRAFKLDPYNVRVHNLLTLFEEVIPRLYTTVTTAHFRFRVEPKTRAAIESVVAPFMERTYRHYVERYGFEPDGPISVELYGKPEHYSVRTVGTMHLGLAAVCFGKVITSQAPSNAAFNWGMVLAHELAHVFAIQLSHGRVPRWFTEGLSEVETMRLRPEWERRQDLELWGGLHAGQVPPLVELSQAFTRARNLDEAARAYMLGAVVMDWLDRRFGFARIREALAAYGKGERGAPVLERLGGAKAAAMDAEFRAYLGQRLAHFDTQFLPTQTLRRPLDEAKALAAKHPKDARALAEAGLAELAAGNARAAQEWLDQAKALPQAGEDEALRFAGAELFLAQKKAMPAAALLDELVTRGHDGYDIRVRLALANVKLDKPAVAETHLRRAIEFDPTTVAARALLAEVLEKAGPTRAAERLALIEAAIRLEPQNARVAKQLLLAHAGAGRSGKVVDLAPLATFTDPGDADVHAAIGRALVATGHTADGAAELELALLFAPTDGAALHRTLAELYTKLGDATRAAEHRRALGGTDATAATPPPTRAPASSAPSWMPAPTASPPPRAPAPAPSPPPAAAPAP